MASKPKNRNYIVVRVGTFGQPRYTGRYRVGARNEAEAENLVRGVLGKHVQVSVYYEEKNDTVPHGTVINEITKEVLRR